MFKTTLIAVIAALCINIAGFKAYDIYIEQQFEGQVVTTNYLNDKITNLKSNILDLKADSIGSISHADLDDTKKFIEYEVSMNKKSIRDFIDSLNKDMERLNTLTSLSQENDEHFQEKIEYLLQEIQIIQDQITVPLEIIDVPVVTPEEIRDVPVVVEQETIPVVATPAEPKETNTHIESYPVEECTYALEGGRQNSTKTIQRAVDSLRKKGSYTITALFSINTQGQAEELVVQSNNAPSKLERAVQKYVSKLNFVPIDTVLFNCEMSFNLNVT